MKKNIFTPKLLGLGVISAAVLAACGGGGGGAATVAPGTTLSGVASKGILSGALVTAYCTTASGPSAVLGTATTGADGSYSISYTASCSTPVQLVMTIPPSGAYMYDEVTGQNSAVHAGSLTLRSFLANSASTNQAQITPFTDMVAAVISNVVAASGPVAMNSSTVNTAVTAIQQQLFPNNPNLYYVKPVTPASAAAATGTTGVEQQQLSSLLTSIAARAHHSHGGDVEAVIRELEDSAKASTTISGTAATIVVPVGASSPTAVMNQAISDAKAEIANGSMKDAEAEKQVNSNSTNLVPTTPVSGTISAPTPGVTAAKNLINSLRTNLQQLSNSSKTGFLDTEVAAMKTDFAGFKSTSKKTSDFLHIIGTAKNMLAHQIMGSVYPGGGMCTQTTAGTVTCDWGYSLGTSLTYHETTFNGYTGAPNTNESLAWSDQLGTPVFTPGTMATTLQAIGSAQTGTFTVTNNSNTQKTVSISGNLGALDTTADHSGINVTGTINSGTTDTLNLTGGITNYDASNSALLSLEFDPKQTSVIDVTPATATASAQPTSATLYGIAQSVHFKFIGQISLSGGMVSDKTGQLHQPKTTTFTGSVTDRSNPNIGTFMNGTMSDTQDLSNFSSNMPISSSNYKSGSFSFSGTLNAGSSGTFSLSSVNDYLNSPQYGNDSIQFTYTDPSKTAVNVTITRLPNTPISIAVTSNGVTASYTVGGSGSITDSSNSSTIYGDITGKTISYKDGTTESLN